MAHLVARQERYGKKIEDSDLFGATEMIDSAGVSTGLDNKYLGKSSLMDQEKMSTHAVLCAPIVNIRWLPHMNAKDN